MIWGKKVMKNVKALLLPVAVLAMDESFMKFYNVLTVNALMMYATFYTCFENILSSYKLGFKRHFFDFISRFAAVNILMKKNIELPHSSHESNKLRIIFTLQ